MSWLLVPGIVMQIGGLALFGLSVAEVRMKPGALLMVAAFLVYTIGATLIFKAGAPP